MEKVHILYKQNVQNTIAKWFWDWEPNLNTLSYMYQMGTLIWKSEFNMPALK